MRNPKTPPPFGDALRKIGAVGAQINMAVYAVGGYVRDWLLGHPIHEIDFVVLGDGPTFAQEALQIMRGHGLVVYDKFGTASFISDNLKFEFVTARKESYRDDSRKPDVKVADLEQDLVRRDFTINTLALSVNPESFGQLIDLFHGRKDLKARIIRTPLEPEKTFFEDPLRIMRAARFASQLGFDIHPDTLSALRQQRDRLSIVSQERITDEMLKMLSHSKPSIGFRILNETGVLEIIFPELAALQGTEQRDSHHHKDVFEHTLKVMDNLAEITDNPVLRFTALVHDIGKPRVKRFVEGTGWTFHGHELVGVRMLRQICQKLRLSREYMRTSQKLTQLHMRPIHLIGEGVTNSAVRRLIVQAGDNLDDLMALCRADITSGNPKRVKRHLANFDELVRRMAEVEETDRMRAFQSPVRGDEIMSACGISPGPLVGKLKTMIEEAILEGQIPNEHDAAYDFLLKIKNQVVEITD